MSGRFVRLAAVAAALPFRDIDTDMILAGRFLKTITRRGLGDKLFHALRYHADGSERADFVLNREPWRRAGILVTQDNFGCGSSREHAPWALLDFGIRCVIAPSFADIFHNNCFKNFILPIALPREVVELLLSDASDPVTCHMTIDLKSCTITRSNGRTINFETAPERRHALLNGLDEINESLAHLGKIAQWEQGAGRMAPPIPLDIGRLSDVCSAVPSQRG